MLRTKVHMADIPDLRWYTQISGFRKVPIRCPHATVEACPRYYQSLSLLRHAGCTAIPEEEDKRLLMKWKASDLWPRTMEQATSVDGEQQMFTKFCPEVTFDRFGYFATSLGRYVDEIDSEAAHKRLQAEGAPHDDPRWSWFIMTAQHYTACPTYSVLSHRANSPSDAEPEKPEPWLRKHFWELVTAVVGAIVTAVISKLLG